MTNQTTLERPWLGHAARSLSKHVIGLVRPDWDDICIIVSHCDIAPPKNFQGYPVIWERANG